jgi:glutamyl-tRNA synthetase
MTKNVRVRFAPSPTGPLHIGGVRTALFNYLFAKKNKGTFILRIEDTDQTRYVANAEQYITDSLAWCGIPFDEGVGVNEKMGPYRQSERKAIYKEHVQKLIDSGNAYYAFDTAEALNVHRKEHEANKKTFIYNHHNRLKLDNSLVLSQEEVATRIATGANYVIRFKTPTNEILKMQDLIRGEIKIDTNLLDDKILFKSDGMPTYHLANIVDDHLMEISHVIRGEEWLPSMALHILLYRAFGWDAPDFAHLPLILKPVGKGKLSKRDGAKLGFPVFPMAYTDEKVNETYAGYKEDGYFPEAFINMLALLGWNPGTEQELFTLEELINVFDLNKVSKSGAKFSPDKTKWFQQQYMQQKPTKELLALFNPILETKLGGFQFKDFDTDYRLKVIDLIKERAVFVADLWDLGAFFFTPPQEYDAKASKKAWKENTEEILNKLIAILNSQNNFDKATIETVVKNWITESEIGFGRVLQPFRLALVGSLKGPDLFEIASMLGKEETIGRLNRFINKMRG